MHGGQRAGWGRPAGCGSAAVTCPPAGSIAAAAAAAAGGGSADRRGAPRSGGGDRHGQPAAGRHRCRAAGALPDASLPIARAQLSCCWYTCSAVLHRRPQAAWGLLQDRYAAAVQDAFAGSRCCRAIHLVALHCRAGGVLSPRGCDNSRPQPGAPGRRQRRRRPAVRPDGGVPAARPGVEPARVNIYLGVLCRASARTTLGVLCMSMAQEDSVRQMSPTARSVCCMGVQASVRVLTCQYGFENGGVNPAPGEAGVRGCCLAAARRPLPCWRPPRQSRERRQQEATSRVSTSGSAPCAGSAPGWRTVGCAAGNHVSLQEWVLCM